MHQLLDLSRFCKRLRNWHPQEPFFHDFEFLFALLGNFLVDVLCSAQPHKLVFLILVFAQLLLLGLGQNICLLKLLLFFSTILFEHFEEPIVAILWMLVCQLKFGFLNQIAICL